MSLASPLEQFGKPLFYRIPDHGLDSPQSTSDAAQRVHVRTLEAMQKEAIVVSSRSGAAWRLASDEGEYLDGHDVAPSPLCFFMTGVVSSVTNRIQDLADTRDITLADLEVIVDTFYTMQGSALRGDMTGGALPPEFDVSITGDASANELTALVDEAVATAPVMGLVTEAYESLFSLSLNGEELDPDRVSTLDSDMLADPHGHFEDIPRDRSPQGEPLLTHTGEQTEEYPGGDASYTAGAGSSLQEEQDRVLHLRATCTIRDDGVKRIQQRLYSPRGSIFEVLSDEPTEDGDIGRAPDALTYTAAGIGFCFMTQFGRYADIVGKQLDAYRIVQDTHFGVPAESRPVETHVFLESPEGPVFAQDILGMSEQTCFLHALCRTDLEPTVDVQPS